MTCLERRCTFARTSRYGDYCARHKRGFPAIGSVCREFIARPADGVGRDGDTRRQEPFDAT